MLPEVTYYVGASLDGFLAREDGSVDWLDCVEDGDEDYGYAEFFATVDGLLMGRATYDFARAHEPWVYGDTPCWVWSHRELGDAPPAVSVTTQAPRELLAELGARGLRHLWLVGGGQLAGAFAREGLISSLVISVVPVVLGKGIPLLGDEGLPGTLALQSSQSYRSGLVRLVYATARS